MQSKKSTGFPLRMPQEIRDWLQQAADENGRSLNSEIVQRLKALKAREEIAKQDKRASE